MKTAIETACQKIITAGWANRSNGDVNAPTGHFALIDLPENEMPELLDAMSDELDESEFEAIRNEMGNTLFVLEVMDGRVLVSNSPYPVALRLFNSLSDSFEKWAIS